MGTRIPTVFLIALFHTTSVGAQQDQCLELVRLSRMKTQTIMSQSQFASTVNAYCEERSNSSSAAVSVGGAGYSASASRAEASYGKFCGRDTDDRGSESDYNEYMEGVQPGAYAAYAACEAARNNDGVQFEMSGAPTRDRLVLGIYNRTDTGNTADMQWDGSDPVTCQWAGDARGTPRRTLQPNERAFLECRRSSFDSEPLREPDAVDVFRADGGGAAVLNIPWSKYGPDNSPVQTLEEIRQQIDTEVAYLRAAVDELQSGPRVQSGIVGMTIFPELDLVILPELTNRSGSNRGVRGGRVEFDEPFSSAPEVIIALRQLDAGGGQQNTRISVVITAVDREGFNYNFYTWADTDIYTTMASWIAVARE